MDVNDLRNYSAVDNLISVDDLGADVDFRMHCALTNNVTTELNLLWDGYAVRYNNTVIVYLPLFYLFH